MILSNKWGKEFTFGLGYSYIDYKKYECKKCGVKLDEGAKHYFGPTKACLNIVFIIK